MTVKRLAPGIRERRGRLGPCRPRGHAIAESAAEHGGAVACGSWGARFTASGG